MRKYLYNQKVVLLDEEKQFGFEIPRRYSKSNVEGHEKEWLGGTLQDGWDWQVTYKFPSDFHDNMSNSVIPYGSFGMTQRELYELLCTKYNKGERFIDRYFSDCFQPLKDEFQMVLDGLKNMLQFSLNIGLGDDFDEAIDNSILPEEINYLKEQTKADIENALATGRIPLHFKLKESTKRRREYSNLPREPEFYAGGSLIESIILYFRVKGIEEEW